MSDTDDKRSSPVCYANEADPGYMGFANDEEIATFLSELSDAERTIAEKLRGMLPKIRDDALHAGLKEMLASHERSVAAIRAGFSGG